MKKTFAALSVLALVAGCAAPGRDKVAVDAQMARKRADFIAEMRASAGAGQVRETAESAPKGREIEDIDPRQAVNVQVENVSFYGLLRQIAEKAGYSLAAVPGVELQRPINVDLRKLTPEQAMRKIGWQAGYALIVNERERSVTVAPSASYVFRIPVDAFSRLSSSFSYGGSALSSGGSASTGGTEAGPQVTAIKGDFTVSGSYTTSPTSFERFISNLAGGNADVHVLPDQGLIEVRGNAQALKRVHDFLDRYAYDARRQVEITGQIIEVGLTNEFRYGIQWDKVLNAAGTRNVGLDTLSSAGANYTGSLSVTTSSITSIVRALQVYTDIDSQASPRLVLTNNTGGVIFEGRQVPYLPSIQQTASTVAGGQPTQSGTGAFAQDGVNLAVHANILDDSNAMLRIVPTSLALGDLKSLLGGQIQMYESTVKTGGQSVAIQSGQTLIISGNRFTKSSKVRRGVPGVIDTPLLGDVATGQEGDTEVRETVLLVHARIIRPAPSNILFSESL